MKIASRCALLAFICLPLGSTLGCAVEAEPEPAPLTEQAPVQPNALTGDVKRKICVVQYCSQCPASCASCQCVEPDPQPSM